MYQNNQRFDVMLIMSDDEHPNVFVTITEYVPGVPTAIDDVVAPLLQRYVFPLPLPAYKFILLPWQ